MAKLINTQERRWEHVLDGYMLIATKMGEENIIGIFKGQLYNFTQKTHSTLTLGDVEGVEYSLEMKDNKVRRYLYTWGFTDENSFDFLSDLELDEKKKQMIGVTFTKHENAWRE